MTAKEYLNSPKYRKQRIDRLTEKRSEIMEKTASAVMQMNKNERALSKLKSLVDADVYLKLRVLLAGESVYFPAVGTAKDKRLRNEQIREDFEHGMNISELIVIYDLSESQIRRILKNGE